MSEFAKALSDLTPAQVMEVARVQEALDELCKLVGFTNTQYTLLHVSALAEQVCEAPAGCRDLIRDGIADFVASALKTAIESKAH